MIKVRFRVNLGSTDAAKLDIADFRECVVGAEVVLQDTTAQALEKAGIVSVIEVIPPPKPAPPPEPEPVAVAATAELVADPATPAEPELTADPPVATDKGKKQK